MYGHAVLGSRTHCRRAGNELPAQRRGHRSEPNPEMQSHLTSFPLAKQPGQTSPKTHKNTTLKIVSKYGCLRPTINNLSRDLLPITPHSPLSLVSCRSRIRMQATLSRASQKAQVVSARPSRATSVKSYAVAPYLAVRKVQVQLTQQQFWLTGP